MTRYKEIADHFYALADLFNELGADSATAPVSAGRPAAAAVPAAASASSFDELPPLGEAAPSFADESVDFAPQGSLEVCPKHKSSYLPSKFKEGKFYCPANSDDPAWSNSKGKCRITPDNAAEYLRIKAAA